MACRLERSIPAPEGAKEGRQCNEGTDHGGAIVMKHGGLTVTEATRVGELVLNNHVRVPALPVKHCDEQHSSKHTERHRNKNAMVMVEADRVAAQGLTRSGFSSKPALPPAAEKALGAG